MGGRNGRAAVGRTGETGGLDPETAAQVMANILSHITKTGQSLLLITHRRHGLEAMDAVFAL